MNILDYVDWRGDLSFSASPFNEVDNLVFSTLAYLDLTRVIPEGSSLAMRDVCRVYSEKGLKSVSRNNDPYPLLEKCAASNRFGNVRVSDHVSDTDGKRGVQFSATLFNIKKDLAYAAFRGTDNTIVGWKEDFELALPDSTEGQKEAAEYLDDVAGKTKAKLIVGGHSKGGNLAVYGAAFCSEDTKTRIREIYSNDGPGFRKGVTETQEYLSVIDRVRLIIPESSVVGIIMSSKKEKKIVRSSATGFHQHFPLTWEVIGNSFVEADRAEGSVFLDETLEKWLSEMSDDELRVLCSAVFDSIEASGASTIRELNSRKRESYSAILKAAAKLPPQTRKTLTASVKKLLASTREVMKEKR